MKPLYLFASTLGCLCLAGATVAPGLAAAPAPAPAPQAGTVDPEALDALGRMGSYLRTLQTFKITISTVTDEVTEDGQKLQFTGQNTYRVRRPDALAISMVSDRLDRSFYLADKSLTVVAPKMGFYAKAPAPGTIREALDKAYDDYGIALPLEDLFSWTESDPRAQDLKSGFWVGYARVDGVDCDQYAFRERDIDWQIWIARGAKPTPQKVVITTRDDDTQPQFAANLKWDTAAKFTKADFTYAPPAGAKSIILASFH